MLPFRRNWFALAICFQLIAALTVRDSSARELRPSDHGLTYQSSPATGVDSPAMASFFSGASRSSAPPPSSQENLPLPEASNATDPTWHWGDGGGGRGKGGGGHVRGALLVASVVCGVTGVVMLLAAAALFIFQLRKKRATAASLGNK